jgi:hypothetical protein
MIGSQHITHSGALFLVATLLVFSLSASPASGAQSPSARASEIAKIVNSLREVIVEAHYQKLPAAATPGLFQLKDRLRDLVEAVISTSPERASGDEIKGAVIAALNDAGVQLGPEDEESIRRTINAAVERGDWTGENGPGTVPYGAINEIVILRPEEHPDLIVAKITVAVECGEDTSFYIWRISPQGLAQILSSNAKEYDAINGAQWEFEYKISGNRPDGSFLVVTASVNVWCSSSWQTLTYAAYLISQNGSARQVLLEKRLIFVGENYISEVTPEGFSISFISDDKDNPGIDREFHFQYLIEGNEVRLVP